MSVCRGLAVVAVAYLVSACGGAESPPPGDEAGGPPSAREFSGDAALGYARAQLEFGPRVPGTEAARKAGDWITARMRERADTVIEQRWTHRTQDGRQLPLRNILAQFRPDAADRILLLAHWDSRPVADRDPDPARQRQPVPGANDGASGVGLLVAIADALQKTPPAVGVDLLFVDGEDWGTFGPPDVDVLLGSTYFAAHLPSPGYKPLFAVLFDMIGDRDLQLYQEVRSVRGAPEVVQRVWDTARALGYESVFIPEARYDITDDHVPLLAAGIRAIDVIDIEYDAHHTTGDTLDRISARSLQIVGDVAMAVLRR